MDRQRAQEVFLEIRRYYDAIPRPRHRNIDIQKFKERYDELTGLKHHLQNDAGYNKLVNAMSQIMAKLKRQERLAGSPGEAAWSNLSERGMNKVIPPIHKNRDTKIPLEWTDKWGNTCYVSNGHWAAKNYRVMDALGYMFLLKEGGGRLPEDYCPIFYDLYEVQVRENQLNELPASKDAIPDPPQIDLDSPVRPRYSIGFTDRDFRRGTGLEISSSEILELLLQTSRVEFKVSFPVRLRTAGQKETFHRMNFFSRFFELAYEEEVIRKDGLVRERRYRVYFNTLLGELFVNNLKARYNDRIDPGFYNLLDSAQIFYRRLLLHNSFPSLEIHLSKIAQYAGLEDSNESNLIKTVESSILTPLKESGFIESYERTEGLEGIKYVITRRSPGKPQGDMPGL
jgi:hypothetical protein